MTVVDRRYFKWLCQRISIGRKDYGDLLEVLYETPFTWVIPKDENRAEDGLTLRDIYSEEVLLTNSDYSVIFNKPCSVLEMVIALINRMLDVEDEGYDFAFWFWEIMSSIGIDIPNDRFNREYVKMKLEKCMNRQFKPNGDGGWFYIPGIREDLTAKEIWYIMQYKLNYID